MQNQHLKEQLYTSHPRIPDAFSALRDGKITRREFIRFATLLGMSASLATACGQLATNGLSVQNQDLVGSSSQAAQSENRNNGVLSGGTLIIGTQLQDIKHPANLTWPENSNIVRQVAEYLTLTNKDNITTPYLLDRWETNIDVSEWTLHLRKGVLFNNGDELIADDVIFNS